METIILVTQTNQNVPPTPEKGEKCIFTIRLIHTITQLST